jgi:RHS repeat-associated protein
VISYRYDELENQGQLQPFGYTGYQRDTIAGTYYAQAREYDAWSGRFTSEDVVKGSVAYPETLNAYGYCWGNPVKYVDRDGEFPLLAIVPVAFFMVAVLYGCNSNKKNGGKKSNQTTTTEKIPKESNVGISIDDYHVEDRKDLIEFIKYAEGEYWDKPYDSNEDGILDTIGYGHDFTKKW